MKELSNYKEKGSFTFKKGNDLKDQSNKVANKAGVYCIYSVKGDIEKLVYIGKSGTINQDGSFKDQLLNKRINNKQDGIPRKDFFSQKLEKENIEMLKIYWYVTFNNEFKDLPAFVEAMLIQSYYTENRCLPAWNKTF